MTSSKLPEGYEICPHCEGYRAILYAETYPTVCRLCGSSGIVDWVTKVIHTPRTNREKPFSDLEQIKKAN